MAGIVYTNESGDFITVTQAAANTALANARLLGVLCISSTGGTITIADNPGSGRTVIPSMSLTAGQFYRTPAKTVGQVTITVGGTATVVVFYTNL